MSAWAEIDTAAKEKRREIVLTGQVISKRIEDAGLDASLYKLVNLNFLEISKTGLTELSEDLGGLVNLTNLALHTNKLMKLPASIAKLLKLKQLDVSNNALTELPSGLSDLRDMHTLNCSSNALESFPDMSALVNMHVLDISHNQLTALPDGLHHPPLDLLSTLNASSNKLEDVPASVASLPQLKYFDISDNKLTEVPAELGECGKLRELNYGGNKLKDRRLAKMMDQCTTKSVLEYLRNILEKERAKGGGKGDKKEKKKKKKGHHDDENIADLAQNMMDVLRFSEGATIRVTPAVADVRPYIVCCIVRNLNFHKSLNMFKRFITLQTKLHEGICKKRQAATIATHDLRTIKAPLTYDARPPSDIKLLPLFSHKETTADVLVKTLRDEAEALRKQKKRSSVSGIHQYLDLLKGKAVYPVLLDTDDTVISFPPITNCEVTKVSKETTDILIEVTSSVSLDTCKSVMADLLKMMLETGVGTGPGEGQNSQSEAAAETTPQSLTIEQVKVTDIEGNLKVVYPSRTDLVSSAYAVNRNYE